jgi:hypothetical protein
MAKRKKKHQKERVLEPLVEPGQPIEVPDKAPAMTPLRVAAHAQARGAPVAFTCIKSVAKWISPVYARQMDRRT